MELLGYLISLVGSFLFVGLVVLLPLAYFFYVGLIKKRNAARQALSGVSVHLTKRHDVIPNVLTIAQKFLNHERELFTEIAELRTRADAYLGKNDPATIRELMTTEDALDTRMQQLFAVAEGYPELKSSDPMVEAIESYREIESEIAAARRFYNSAVTDLNNSVEIFPGSMIAEMLGVREMPLYEAPTSHAEPVNAASILH